MYINNTLPVKRFWSNDITENAVMEELNHMKEGGNRNLRIFLNYYSIPRGIKREVVFISKIINS